jgi:hypothetical protein
MSEGIAKCLKGEGRFMSVTNTDGSRVKKCLVCAIIVPFDRYYAILEEISGYPVNTDGTGSYATDVWARFCTALHIVEGLRQ